MSTQTWIRWLIVGMLAASMVSWSAAPMPRAAAQEGGRVRVIFMHHSTGQGLLDEGDLRADLARRGYDLWDHGYNDEGLTDAQGNALGINWDVPGDNTDPDGWYAIFQQPVTDPPANTFSHMLQYDVILFKSCFPTSDIASEEQFQDYQRYFLAMREVMDRYPDKIFIPFTTPPLVPNETTPENAARARRWAQYLTSGEYLSGHPNVFVFDFFSALADADGYLRAEYRADEWDSHPNTLANQTVAPLLAQFVDEAVRGDTFGEPVSVPPLADVEDASAEGEAEAGSEQFFYEEGVRLAQFGDFERGLPEDFWWDYADGGFFTCQASTAGYESAGALELRFDLSLDVYGGCGADLLPEPQWADTGGLSLYWKADRAGLIMSVVVGIADPAQPDAEAVPFEYELEADGTAWTRVFIPWGAFEKADWWGPEGVDTLDPANVVMLAFDVGDWEHEQQGTIWIDDLEIADE